MLTKFGESVRKARQEVGATMMEMADFLGVKPSFLSQMETGKRKIPVGFVEKVEDFFKSKGLNLNLQDSANQSNASVNLDDVDPRLKFLLVGFARGRLDDEQLGKLTEIYNQMQSKNLEDKA